MHTTFARTLSVALALVLLATATLASDESLETLLAYLKSPNVSTRRDAARKLGERRERNQLAVEALAVSARKDDDHDVRLEAVDALGKLKDFTA
ncbi:MAG TPA: HEAT repeat domain-containing protein, partial [Blastocatellia bacterium]